MLQLIFSCISLTLWLSCPANCCLCVMCFLYFLDEVNVDYGKLLKTAAIEGLRVEDLVKQYFEAAEQVR